MLTQKQLDQNNVDMKMDSLEFAVLNDPEQSLFTMKAKNRKGEEKTLLCIRNDEDTFLPIAEMIVGDPYGQYIIQK